MRFDRALMTVVFGLFGLSASAQDFRYHAYFNNDFSPATGCNVVYPGGTVSGAEMRLTAEVTGTTVTGVTLATCAAGTFGAGASVGGGYPVGLNIGTGGGDVVEWSATRAQLNVSNQAAVQLLLAGTSNGGASDVLLTPNGQGTTPAIVLGLPFAIPTMGFWAGLVLVAALFWIGLRRVRRLRFAALAALAFAGLVWAINYASDGAIGDWAGENPRATDLTADASPSDDGADVLNLFAAEENGRVFLRVDVRDVENQRPVATAQSITVNEDSGATTITMTATDADNDPLTFAIGTPPTKGVLGVITPINATSASVTYTPNLNDNGADSFTFAANDGQVASLPATVSVTITPVNDAPSFTRGSDVNVVKDSGAQTINPWATALSTGPANESTQTLTFEITGNTNPGMFSAGPSIAPNGSLSFTPAPNQNGSATITVQLRDNGGTANGGVDLSPTQSFVISFAAVNDAPSFTKGPDQTVLEDAGPQTVIPWATAISPGPPDEAGQTLTFNITGNTNAALFSAGPSVSPTGALTYTPAANANGSATITVTLQDNGGTGSGGVDTSLAQTFVINVTAVNDAPSFTRGPDVNVVKDSGAQTINPWATALSTGPANESTQTLTFEITGNTNPGMFSAGPSIAPNGSLSFTPAPNQNGSATITVQLRDNGGTANGGVDVSPTQSFVISFAAVNDAPSFTKGPDQTVLEDAGPQTVIPWATAISPGPPDEAGQTLTFNITGNTNAALFSAGPSVSPTGVLTYTPAANANGSATITLTLQDNGGTAGGGVDTSPAQTFAINVTAVNDVPSFTVGPNQILPVNSPAQIINPWATAISVGPANESAQTLSFNVTNNTNTGLFAVQPSVSPTGVLSFTPAVGASGIATVTLVVQDTGGTASGGVDTSPAQTFTINIDGAPSVLTAQVEVGNTFTTLPLIGANSDSNTDLRLTFSEGVAVAGNWAALNCAVSGIQDVSAGLVVVDADPVYTLNPATDLTPGESCTLTVFAAQISDDDAIDPPNNLAANFVATFDVDAAPAVSSVSPTNGATNVAANANLTVNFSETVTVTGASFTLECPAGTPVSGGFAVSGSGTNSVTINPTNDLPAGVTCTATVVAANVTDVDVADPPNNLAANFVWTFSTDAAPTVTGGAPANGATNVSTAAPITFIFSEPVDATGAAITLACPGAITGTITGTGTNTLTFTPGAALPEGVLCTATAVAANINDSDTNDPPGNLAADVVRTFTTDLAPTVSNTTPANAATSVIPTNNLVVTFSEQVNFVLSDFTIVCNAVPQAFTLAGTGTNTATLTPSGVGGLAAGSSCVFTVLGAAINDVDAGDPPNFVVGNTVVNFTTAAVANDDAFPVTPHLTISSAGGAAELDANDNLGAAVITSFGFGACTGTTAGSQLDAGAANGRLTVNANGSFSYEPPVGVANATRTFCYTITGGDTANIVFNIANTELVWFVDGTAPAGGNGTQARPFQTLAAVAAVDTASDSIFLADGAYTATITLEATERLIGDGSTGNLATHTGVTPVTGSAFPAFSGTAPVITCGGTCITLATDNILRGFTVGDSGLNGTDISGTGFGTLTVNEVTLNGNGQTLNLVTGSLNGNFIDMDTTVNSTNGLRLSAVGGTWSVTGTVTLSSITGGNGITMVSTPSTANIDFIGGVSVTSNAPPPAILINSGGATPMIRFASMNVVNTIGTGLQLVNTPITINGVGNSVAATGGMAIFMQNVNLNTGATFATVTSTGSPGFGVGLDNVTGALTMNGGSIFGATLNSFDVNLGASNVTYAGTITNTAAARLVEITGRTGGTVDLSGALSGTGSSTGINIANNTGGTINLSNASKTLTTGTNPAVTLATNTGSTINFTGGGLVITTTSGRGFDATAGGTVNVTGTGNTLSSTSGIALNVVNTTIGVSGLNFRSISSSGGASSGIVLNSTGASGGLSVLGTGGPGTGGTIQNTTSHGVSLTNTLSPSFNNMNIGSTVGSGVWGTLVTNFTFTNGSINLTGTVNPDSSIALNNTLAGANVQGVVTITGNSLTNARYSGISIYNDTNTISNAVITGNNIVSSNVVASSLGYGIELVGNGTAGSAANLTRATIDSNTIRNFPSGGGIQVIYGNSNASGPGGNAGIPGSGTDIINITNNVARGESAANRLGTHAISVTVSGGNSGNRSRGNFNVSNNGTVGNPIGDNTGTTILIGNNGFSTTTATINNNVIVANNGLAANGIGGGNGITVNSADTPDLTLTANNNSISGVEGNGILLVGRGVTGTARFKIQNNTVAAPTGGTRPGIRVDAGNAGSVDDSVCLNISGNTSAGSGGSQGLGLRKQGTVTTTNDFGVHGMAATATPGIEAYVNGLNPAGNGTLLISATSGFSNCSFP